MEAYFDNSATTKVLDPVRDIIIKTMTEDFGNPSALHLKGIDAENYIKAAGEIIANTLKVQPKEIIFTSGGTESNNLALIGTVLANRRMGNHIITSSIEHPSVLNAIAFLEEQGFQVTYLPVSRSGQIQLEDLNNAITNDTILVSIMHVNNEIGAIQPISEIGALIKKRNPSIVFHVDAIQSYGKFVIRPKNLKVDLLSVSGHKIHGPKGVGFLYRKEGIKVNPIIFGGGQQKGMRSGTENVPGVAGLGVASKLSYENNEEKVEFLYQLKNYFLEGLRQIDGIHVNGLTDTLSAPQIVSVSFKGIRAEVLLHALEEKGIYASAGSACASNHPSISTTLKAIGLDKSLLDSTLRFSFGLFNTECQIDYCIEILKELLPVLRRYHRV